jgi:hypothetical protein
MSQTLISTIAWFIQVLFIKTPIGDLIKVGYLFHNIPNIKSLQTKYLRGLQPFSINFNTTLSWISLP